MTDDLNAPLGVAPRHPLRRRKWPLWVAGALVAAAAAAVLTPRAPFGGEPHAIARIEPAPAAPPVEPPPPRVRPRETGGPPAQAEDAGAAAEEIEGLSGVKITRSGVASGSGARIIRIAPASGVRLPPAPDQRVAENGRYGVLPKIGADGLRPLDAYARPFVSSAAVADGAPNIALVVGGLGLNAQITTEAIERLPEDVTLAFAPYGATLERLAALARARGHETLLQAPMEPFDYPQNNPGPHTLLTGTADGGADDLHWLMSRFSGYAGVMNYLGGRYAADEAALSGTLAEIAQRGLFFLDDGAAAQSLVGSLAPRLALPHARADVALDARASAQALDAALAQLEVTARDRGAAIGFVNATPATIARLARFAHDLEQRGVALAPVSAIVAARDARSADTLLDAHTKGTRHK